MKYIRIIPALLLVTLSSHAQYWHIGVFGGASAYNGDLVDKYFPAHGQTKGAIGLDVTYEYSDHINIRGGFTFGKVSGADQYNKEDLRSRNLSFESNISEFSLLGEYNFFSLYEKRFTPYIYAGVAVFHYEPYAFDANGLKTYLKPLSTEGQGITGYNNRPYSLTQPAIPLGFGVKYAITDNIRVGIEGGYRVLFTDYLDDVSKNYVDQADLLAARGQKAVDMAYRGDEIANGGGYPAKDVQRGSASSKDAYYFVGLHASFRLGGLAGLGGGSRGSARRGYGCPGNF